MKRTVRLVAALCVAEVLGMIGISAFAALLPTFAAEWQLTNTEAGWISGIYYAGYVVAVPLLTSLTDRVDARRIYLASTALGGLASLGFALFADGFWSALLWRTLAGIGLAGTYMPGLKALTDRVGGPMLTRGLGFYTGSFSIGLSLSFLVAGEIDAWLGWRWAFGVAAVGSVLALLLAALALRPAAPEPAAGPRPHLLDFRPVLRNRAAMAYAIAYGAHCWELFGLRAWIVAFLAFALTREGDGEAALGATVVATLGSLVGLPTSLFGNELCLRFGRRRVLIAAMLVSAAVACGVGFAGVLGYGAVAALMIFYGGLVMVDSASLTAGTVGAAAPGQRGATMAVHSSIGFLGAFVGPIVFGAVLDLAGGGASVLAWGLAFASLGIAVALGSAALWRLSRA
ncbi:MAG TPA: MFS transporter [Alphaproteobacteria bacterium]|nr:MFS transporter [Alphaproteobacteria bacterium]